MQIRIENLGPVKEARITTKPITVLFGPNNTGKTYVTYAIWGVINTIIEDSSMKIDAAEMRDLIAKGVYNYKLSNDEKRKIIRNRVDTFAHEIHKIFNCEKDTFKDVKIEVDPDEFLKDKPATSAIAKINIGKTNTLEVRHQNQSIVLTSNSESPLEIPEYILADIVGQFIARVNIHADIARVFAITSERTGAALFYKNADYNKSEIIDYILRTKKINPIDILKQTVPRYSLPIQKNIDFIRDYDEVSKKTSFIFADKEKYADFIAALNGLMQGHFSAVNDVIMYHSANQPDGIPIHLSSSSLKSLFVLDSYLKHEIREGDMLFIDEPEQNLSPKNQVNIAQLIALLPKIGINVFITTHSDYIAREFNIEIFKYHSNPEEGLKPDDVALYLMTDDEIVKPIAISDNGFDVSIFDEEISSQLNRAQM
ncbi:MAG: ATP-binding protein [Deltaproteobacteria bacterium]|nr:ATP-binding protein [Deltaproteobacteria bacterium]